MSSELPPAGTPIRLRLCAIPTTAVGAAACVVAGATSGVTSVWSCMGGVLVVVAFFAVTHVVLQRVLARAPQLAMGAALLLYVTKVAVMLVLVAVLRNVSGLDGKAFGFTVVGCTLTWTFAEVVANLRHRTAYVDATDSPTFSDEK